MPVEQARSARSFSHASDPLQAGLSRQEEVFMNTGNVEHEELNLLLRKGFTAKQITQLCRMRRTYGQDERDRLPLDRHRLEFARWLVAKGRLREEID